MALGVGSAVRVNWSREMVAGPLIFLAFGVLVEEDLAFVANWRVGVVVVAVGVSVVVVEVGVGWGLVGEGLI